jgi:hypothetical protein
VGIILSALGKQSGSTGKEEFEKSSGLSAEMHCLLRLSHYLTVTYAIRMAGWLDREASIQ